MKNYQIAGQVVPAALRAANAFENSPLGAETLIQLTGILSSTIAVCGIKNQKAVRKAAVKAVPEFDSIAETFFRVTRETAVIAETACSKNYDEIAEFVTDHSEMTPTERLKLYEEISDQNTLKLHTLIKKICLAVSLISVIGCICIYFFDDDIHEQVNEDIKVFTGHAQKLWKVIQFFGKGIGKLFSIAGKLLEG